MSNKTVVEALTYEENTENVAEHIKNIETVQP